jgi:hypothetical protein
MYVMALRCVKNPTSTTAFLVDNPVYIVMTGGKMAKDSVHTRGLIQFVNPVNVGTVNNLDTPLDARAHGFPNEIQNFPSRRISIWY